MLTSFLPIFIIAAVSFALAIVMTIIAVYVGPRRPNMRKEDPYECGVIPDKPTLERFDIRYYVIAILFLAFDVEIIFLYPWAVAFDRLGQLGLIEMFIFIAILGVAYWYGWVNGVFEWNPNQGRIERKEDPWNQEEFDK